MRRGFTVLEMLIVVTVILALAGITYPILNRIRERSDISATTELVQSVLAAISAYPSKTFTGSDGKIWPAWTLGQYAQDGTTLITSQMDGDPSLYPSTDPSQLAWRSQVTYTGFVNMTGFPLPWPLNSKGQLVDRWHQPLNILYDPKSFGSSGFGVWSNGPDKQTNYPTSVTGTSADDVTSWKGSGE
jgi:prepilin-type N-terminal cleavage/methylation domain-containing protein